MLTSIVCGCLHTRWQSWVTVTKTVWPAKPRIFAICLTEKVFEPLLSKWMSFLTLHWNVQSVLLVVIVPWSAMGGYALLHQATSPFNIIDHCGLLLVLPSLRWKPLPWSLFVFQRRTHAHPSLIVLCIQRKLFPCCSHHTPSSTSEIFEFLNVGIWTYSARYNLYLFRHQFPLPRPCLVMFVSPINQSIAPAKWVG